MPGVDPKKLDKLLGTEEEEKEEETTEVVEVRPQSENPENLPAKPVDEILDVSVIPIEDDKEFEKFIFDTAKENIEMGAQILKDLKKNLDRGMITEKMYESAAHIIQAISTSIDQVNKVKTQKEKFKLDRAKLAIEKAKVEVQNKEANKPPGDKKTLIITREQLMKEIISKDL